ncbi:MAG: hypothetical protein Fur003_0050 [Candidatus Dojkabacteria bacterium]
MKETEFWGLIDKNQFEEKIDKISLELGEPEQRKRLSIEVSDWADKTLDTRIRITDGKAELMQKKGNWEADTKKEIRIDLKADAAEILNLYEILFNLTNGDEQRTNVIQFENYIWETDLYELKLSHQTGKSDKYNFELELKEENLDYSKVLKKFGLHPYEGERGIAFWDKWNRELNLDARDMTEDELKVLIKSYL